MHSVDFTVQPDWIDEYGHMHAACYVTAFDQFGNELFERCGVGSHYTAASGCGIFTLELHTSYHRELIAGDPLRLQLRVLSCDKKRLVTLLELTQLRDNYLAATMEQLSINVNLETRRVCTFPNETYETLAAITETHAVLPLPPRFVSRCPITSA
ncbi:thioesterase family protein [Caballeronia sp. DA-9]|uniref:thioesterase family protein n=1 Tax=Caballeronia sp. DA-9 TaxID=3436237 RepID=UPI003F679145